MAASCQDKRIRLIDLASKKVIAVSDGHAEVAAMVRFSPDGSKVISVGGDGCTFVWRISEVV
jgi:WD40 repeat protein